MYVYLYTNEQVKFGKDINQLFIVISSGSKLDGVGDKGQYSLTILLTKAITVKILVFPTDLFLYGLFLPYSFIPITYIMLSPVFFVKVSINSFLLLIYSFAYLY